jgi:hypothetical protein
MKKLRSVRALVVLGVLTVLAIFVVLPALASTAGQPVPPPSALHNVTPTDVATGGQPNDCAVFYGTAAPPPYQYRISNPKDGTYQTNVNGTKVTFTIDMNPSDAVGAPAYTNDKYFDFSSTGAAVIDVGVKGGSDSTRYAYAGLGSVSSDTVMHAPAQAVSGTTPTQLYSVSNITFCFALLGSVSGTVYQDNNANGKNDSGDASLAGWTVDLYKNGSPAASTTSGANGSYSFALPFDTSATYRVCEKPASGTWAQTQPLPSAPNICTGSGELGKGYTFTPSSATQNISGDDFGNVPATTCPQPGGISTPDATYQVKLATCKPGVTYVFNAGTTSSGAPFVSVWAGDDTQGKVPMVEKITFSDPIQNGQPKYTKLLYTDAFPFVSANATQMPYCLLDPRTGELDAPAGIDATTVLPSGATSCVISLTTSVDASGHGQMLAYVFSPIDGLRTSG